MVYGMTEICIVFMSTPEEDFECRAETVGYIADHAEVSNEITCGSERHYKRPVCKFDCC
jgi:hypothetical protein